MDTGLTPVIGPGPHQAYKTLSCGGEECRGYWSDPVIGPGPHQAYKTHSCGGEECRGYWSDPRDRAWASSGL